MEAPKYWINLNEKIVTVSFMLWQIGSLWSLTFILPPREYCCRSCYTSAFPHVLVLLFSDSGMLFTVLFIISMLCQGSRWHDFTGFQCLSWSFGSAVCVGLQRSAILLLCLVLCWFVWGGGCLFTFVARFSVLATTILSYGAGFLRESLSAPCGVWGGVLLAPPNFIPSGIKFMLYKVQ